MYLTCAKHRTIFGSTSYNQISRFVKEIPDELLEGYQEAVVAKKTDNFEDVGYRWSYGKGQSVNTYKIDVNTNIPEKRTATNFEYRTAESFLNSIKNNRQNGTLDISKYKEGQRVYHKKFGEGTINKIEQEFDDAKVDITFDKAGHKRLMAKYAGLEII